MKTSFKAPLQKILILTVLIGASFLQACEDDDLCLIGSGTVNEYELSVAQFDAISLSGPINLRIKQGPVQKVSVLAEPELMQPLEYDVDNGELEIGYDGNVTCFKTNFGVWVIITVPDLNEIEASGENIIESDGDLDLDNLVISTSGKATVNLTGKVTAQSLMCSGQMVVHHFNLLAQSTNIILSGEGTIDVSCAVSLDIDVDGAATIYYKGNPTITQNVSGTLNLINAN